MLPALLWLAYMALIGYAFVTMSLKARTWAMRVALAVTALLAVLLATYYAATHLH